MQQGSQSVQARGSAAGASKALEERDVASMCVEERVGYLCVQQLIHCARVLRLLV